MRGLTVGESPTIAEIGTESEPAGALLQAEIISIPEPDYELPPNDPSLYSQEKVDAIFEEMTAIPTISENNEPSEEEKDRYLDDLIDEINLDIAHAKNEARTIVEVIDGASLNKAGYLRLEGTDDQNGVELILPSIDNKTGAPETKPLIRTETTTEKPKVLTIETTLDVAQSVTHTETVLQPEVLTEVEQLTETIMSIHEAISPEKEVTNRQENETNIAESFQHAESSNLENWDQGFSYTVENSALNSLEQDNDIKDDEKPFNLPRWASRGLEIFHIFGPEPKSIRKNIIEPTFIQNELDVESKITDPSPEVLFKNTTWLEEIAEPDEETVEVLEETPVTAVETPVNHIEEAETLDYIFAQDEADIQELLDWKNDEQYSDNTSEPAAPTLVEVPQISYLQTETYTDNEEYTIVEPVAETLTVPEIHNTQNEQTTATRSEEQRSREIEALRRLNLGSAAPIEVAKIVAKESMAGREFYAFIQNVVANYNEAYSIDDVWELYLDGHLRTDGTIMMTAADQHAFNQLLIDSYERVNDTQFA